jgi:8-oxo-dGTP pyrophosphatase MutT (NUDIX family)
MPMIGKEELRLLLRDTCPPSSPVLGADSTAPAGVPANAGVTAAVLVGLVANPGDPRLILTLRTPGLRTHAGQISFPGGRVEEGDEGPQAAALRETCEEIGLPAERVELLGCLPVHLTVSRFMVHPFVGWVEPPVDLRPDPREVDQIIQVPLAYVLDGGHYRRETLELDDVAHTFWVLYYRGHRIWGATAGILVSLARLLGHGPLDVRSTRSGV